MTMAPIAAFHVDERLQPGARAAVDALARDGLAVAIASGDAQAKVASVAAALGIKTWVARQAPADKLAWLASLRASRRARRRRRRRRERRPDARRRRRRGGGELGRRRGAGGERHRDHRQARRACASANARAADAGDPATEPALGARLQPRRRTARRAWLRTALARRDRHVGELARRRAERVANRPRDRVRMQATNAWPRRPRRPFTRARRHEQPRCS